MSKILPEARISKSSYSEDKNSSTVQAKPFLRSTWITIHSIINIGTVILTCIVNNIHTYIQRLSCAWIDKAVRTIYFEHKIFFRALQYFQVSGKLVVPLFEHFLDTSLRGSWILIPESEKLLKIRLSSWHFFYFSWPDFRFMFLLLILMFLTKVVKRRISN